MIQDQFRKFTEEEIIPHANEWHLKDDLVVDAPYDVENDFQFYKCPSKLSGTRISLQAGHFAIFFTEDGHRPQINDGKNDSVLKAVVKIHRNLLS